MKSYFRNFRNYIIKIAAIMAGVIFLFFCFQILVFCIPEKYMVSHVDASLETLEDEGALWQNVFIYSQGTILDNVTDQKMLRTALSQSGESESVFYRAMDCNGYARYWHGYLVFLKPLLSVISYSQIRYLYMFLYLMFFASTTLAIGRNLGNGIAFTWAASLAAVNFIVLPFSLQFSSVFFVLFSAILVLSKLYRGYNLGKTGIFFMIVGMITSYVDFLTAPLLTLGIPLVYLMLLQFREYREESYKKNLLTMLTASGLWGVGYLGNWFSKWVLGSIILKRNVIMDGLAEAVFRTGNTQDDTSSWGGAIHWNLYALLPPGTDWDKVYQWFAAGVLIVLTIVAVAMWKSKEKKRFLFSQIPFGLVAMYPYIWYYLMTNHSQIHSIFTYRIQMITVWIGLSIAVNCIKEVCIHRRG